MKSHACETWRRPKPPPPPYVPFLPTPSRGFPVFQTKVWECQMWKKVWECQQSMGKCPSPNAIFQHSDGCHFRRTAGGYDVFFRSPPIHEAHSSPEWLGCSQGPAIWKDSPPNSAASFIAANKMSQKNECVYLALVFLALFVLRFVVCLCVFSTIFSPRETNFNFHVGLPLLDRNTLEWIWISCRRWFHSLERSPKSPNVWMVILFLLMLSGCFPQKKSWLLFMELEHWKLLECLDVHEKNGRILSIIILVDE